MICPYCGTEVLGRIAASHKLHCKEEPQELKDITNRKIAIASSKRITTDETKKKISIARKEYLKDNPDKVPYKLNHKHKKTYPEIYFSEVLPLFLHNYKIPETLYEGDFVNPLKKIIIEIDGEQHYVDKKIVAHDIIRTNRLEELGWTIIRIRWSHFQKLDRQQKENIVNQLNEHNIQDIDLSILWENSIKRNYCKDCGVELKTTHSERCIDCSKKKVGIDSRKFNPSKEELQELINTKTISEIARIYNVSFNAIKKRCRRLNISRLTPCQK